VNKSYLIKPYFIILLVGAIFLMSCSEINAGNSDGEGNSEISAAAASKIYKACKYPDGEFCDKECCEAGQKCGDAEGYKKCDLDDGEWKENIYSDNKCSSQCAPEAIDTIKLDKNVTVQLQACSEGWKCIDRRQRAYRNADCTFGETENCKAGCSNDICIQICTPGNFTCKNDALKVCSQPGDEWEHYMNCEYGCEGNTCAASPAQKNQTQDTAQNSTAPAEGICGNSCFSVTEFNYNPEGNECQTAFLNGEYVTLKNNCAFSCELTGWSISDAASHVYTFSSFSLGSGNAFTLYSGAGTDTSSQLYWNSPYTPCKAIWNNDGDTLNLKNSNGEIMLTYTYP